MFVPAASLTIPFFAGWVVRSLGKNTDCKGWEEDCLQGDNPGILDRLKIVGDRLVIMLKIGESARSFFISPSALVFISGEPVRFKMLFGLLQLLW